MSSIISVGTICGFPITANSMVFIAYTAFSILSISLSSNGFSPASSASINSTLKANSSIAGTGRLFLDRYSLMESHVIYFSAGDAKIKEIMIKKEPTYSV